MPCLDNGPTPPLNYVSVHSYNQLKDALNNATRAACAAMTAIYSHDREMSLTGSGDVLTWAADYMYIKREDALHAFAWFRDHAQADKDRKQALIESAKAKLTPEEREALCLK